MRLVSAVIDGVSTPALLREDRLLPLARNGVATMLDLLALDDPKAYVEQRRLAAGSGEWRSLADTELDLPIPRPGKIICIGLNYRDHAAEGGHQIPDYPALFTRAPLSFTAPGRPLIRPEASTRFDYEAELAIVIGRRCRHVGEAEALDCVFGYTMLNDGSIRDYQRRSAQWTAGKNFDRTGSFGPALVSADELPPGAVGLSVRFELNGTLLQDGNTAEMIFPVAKAVSIISEIMTLEPGDLIATGTPAGVGFARTPPVWLEAGDICTVSIEGIGRLTNPVADEVKAETRRVR